MRKIVFLIVVIIVIFGIYYLNGVFLPASDKFTEVIFTIEEGQGVNGISQNLKEQNLIKSKFIFETYIWLRDLESEFKAGDHALTADMSIREVANNLISLQSITKERTIQIIEGWSSKQIAEYLEAEGFFSKNDFFQEIDRIKKYAEMYDFINSDEVSSGGGDLEGFLFPDTYRVYSDASPEDILIKMLNNFDNKFNQPLIKQAIASGMSLYEVLTLASIIEKEVATDKDMAMAADIFIRRMDEGIALQSDATINYITGKKTVRPSAEDLAQESNYNTYKHRGLTPGPICNPGLTSIQAVLKPEPNEYWYFLTTEEEEVIYSKNFEEHKANKAKYLN